MQNDLRLFSNYVLGLNARAIESDLSTFLNWAVRGLADTLGFDSAWYGWSHFEPTGPIIHSSTTFNLPKDYYDAWTEIADQDVIVTQFLEDPYCVASYDRTGALQTDGMQSLSDRYGLTKMATAFSYREPRTESFFLSAYRGDGLAKPWSASERQFLQCAIDNISASAQLSIAAEQNASDEQSAIIYLNKQGVSIIGSSALRQKFGHIWSRHDDDNLPRCLTDYIDQPGEHLLIDQDLVAICEPVSGSGGLALQKFTLRPIHKFDLLTARERDVARMLAQGKSHKETARLLGVAPSTVRNQTQSIYEKLAIDNRAMLATVISEATGIASH